LYDQGLVRAIGVSNFNIHHLEDLMGSCRIKPMVNQVEMHPLHT
jgi:diketogulonate reductase-like aldo/keto reductase